jgi:hypothetical protein
LSYDANLGRIVTLEVYDLKGALVLEKSIEESAQQFDIGSFATGTYTFEFTTADGQKVQKKIIKK